MKRFSRRATIPSLVAAFGLSAWFAGLALADEDAAVGQGSFGVPAAPPIAATVQAIRGATVHPVVGPELANAVVLIENGKISAIGADVPIPSDAAVTEGAGLHLYPGLIDADTQLGLVEVSTVRGSVDTQETGRVNPDVRAETAVNPSSHLIGVARGGGVTTALITPSGDLLAGYSALMNLSGWTWEEMLVKSQVGQHLIFPRLPRQPSWQQPKKSDEDRKKERDKKLKELNRVFDDAEAYLKAAAASPRAGRPLIGPELRLEALAPVLQGEIPLIVTATDLPTIKSAVEWAEKRKLRIILRGGADAYRYAKELAEKKIPVLLQETLSLPERDDEPYDTPFTTASVLHAAGVQFCFTSGGNTSLVMNLPHQAAMAVAYGLDPAVGLEAITIAPARILGVDARLGSIEVGKDANLILTDGDPLEIRTHVVAEWIAGKPVDLRSKHVLLYELWKSRPTRTK